MLGEGRREDQENLPEAAAAVSGWIPIQERPPADEDGDVQGCVLAWHRYNGTIVLHVRNIVNFGSFITHWMPTPAAPMD